MKKITLLLSFIAMSISNNNQAQTSVTLAGNGNTGIMDGTGTTARFNFPLGISKDAQGNMIVADFGNGFIRTVSTTGNVTTPFASQFTRPQHVVKDSAGNFFVICQTTYNIYKYSTTGILSSFAGHSTTQGSSDGTGQSARFTNLNGLTIDANDNLYVCDQNRIRKITPAGVVTTYAGSFSIGSTDGTLLTATFNNLHGIVIDGNNNFYVADRSNNKIRKISSTGQVITIAGSGEQGYANGSALTAKFYNPSGVNVDNLGNVYVADTYNHSIRKIDTYGNVTTFVGNGTGGNVDGMGSEVRLFYPNGIVLDNQNTLYITDSQNNKIRKITQNLSVEEFTLASKVEMYPVPVTNILNIVNSNELVVNSYSVIDTNGRKLVEATFDTTSSIDLTNYTSGIYFIQLQTDKGMLVKKVIKE